MRQIWELCTEYLSMESAGAHTTEIRRRNVPETGLM